MYSLAPVPVFQREVVFNLIYLVVEALKWSCIFYVIVSSDVVICVTFNLCGFLGQGSFAKETCLKGFPWLNKG